MKTFHKNKKTKLKSIKQTKKKQKSVQYKKDALKNNFFFLKIKMSEKRLKFNNI